MNPLRGCQGWQTHSALAGTHANPPMHSYAGCREHAPSIIFMDEVDSIGSARTDNSGGGGDSEVQRTMLELLNQLDGFEATNKIKVGCASGFFGGAMCVRQGGGG